MVLISAAALIAGDSFESIIFFFYVVSWDMSPGMKIFREFSSNIKPGVIFVNLASSLLLLDIIKSFSKIVL